MHAAIQLVGLFVGIWFAAVNAVRMYAKQNLPASNFAIMAAGWTAFIWATWLS